MNQDNEQTAATEADQRRARWLAFPAHLKPYIKRLRRVRHMSTDECRRMLLVSFKAQRIICNKGPFFLVNKNLENLRATQDGTPEHSQKSYDSELSIPQQMEDESKLEEDDEAAGSELDQPFKESKKRVIKAQRKQEACIAKDTAASTDTQKQERKVYNNYTGFCKNKSTDNTLGFRLGFDLQMIEHFISLLMIFGTDQVSTFGNQSPVFKDVPASRLVSLREQVLGITSVKGYEKMQLNIYKLALYNRHKYLLCKAMKRRRNMKNGRYVRPFSDYKPERLNILRQRLTKNFLASADDIRHARTNYHMFQKYKRAKPIDTRWASMVEKMQWLERLEEYLNLKKLNPFIDQAGDSFELFKKEMQWRRQQILFFQHGPLNKPKFVQPLITHFFRPVERNQVSSESSESNGEEISTQQPKIVGRIRVTVTVQPPNNFQRVASNKSRAE